MGSLDLTYALPVSCVRVEGTITETTDEVLKTTQRTPEATVTLHVHGLVRDQTLRIKTGFLRDTSISLELTDDGRLKSTDAESTGQLGRVVLGIVGAGATVAGLLTSPVATAVAAAAGAVAGGPEAFTGDRPQPQQERDRTPAERVDEAYAKAHERLAGLRTHYLALIDQTVGEVAGLAQQLVESTQPSERRRLLGELRRSEELLPLLRAELEPLNAHFKAWRSSTIHSRIEHHQRCFSLDALRLARASTDADDVHFGATEPEPAITFAWREMGVAVTMKSLESVKPPAAAAAQRRANAILVRLPRRVQLSVWERVDGKPVLRDQRAHIVVDALSATELFELRRSLWARRSVKLGFSDLGVVTSYSHGATSSAAAAADALGGIPASVSGGLEHAMKIRSQGAALRTASLDSELTVAKKRVELKQQEITAAGLAVTEADSAELARLEQQAAMAEHRKTLRDPAEPPAPTGAAAEIALLKQRLDLLTTRRDVAAVTQQIEADTQLGVLRLEVERLRLEAQKRAAGDAD